MKDISYLPFLVKDHPIHRFWMEPPQNFPEDDSIKCCSKFRCCNKQPSLEENGEEYDGTIKAEYMFEKKIVKTIVDAKIKR